MPGMRRPISSASSVAEAVVQVLMETDAGVPDRRRAARHQIADMAYKYVALTGHIRY
jgi:hypothetical protein